jgi:hypothetical protein
MRLFKFLAILKYVGLPPAPMINVGKSGLNFLFSVIQGKTNRDRTFGRQTLDRQTFDRQDLSPTGHLPAEQTLDRQDNSPTRFFTPSLFSKVMLTGNNDSLHDSYKLIRLLVKLMTRAGIVSRFHCLKAL